MGRVHALCSEHMPSDISQGRVPIARRGNLCHPVVGARRDTPVFRASVRRKGPLSDNAWPSYGQCSGYHEAGVPSPCRFFPWSESTCIFAGSC